MQANLNEYNQKTFEPAFVQSDLYKKLKLDFVNIDFLKHWKKDPTVNLFTPDHILTPRQIYGTKEPSIFYANIFYYLQWLLEKNPQTIIDLGCGWNIFKKYIPNVVGIGSELPDSPYYFADIHDYVDDDFVRGHRDSFESVFSINALHFIPLSQFRSTVIDFHDMISPGGRGFLAMNIQRMVERESSEMKYYSLAEQENYIRNQLQNTAINFLVVDIDLTVPNEVMNGNIRLVMEK